MTREEHSSFGSAVWYGTHVLKERKMGPRINLTSFNPASKNDWLGADLAGLFYTTLCIFAGILVIAILLNPAWTMLGVTNLGSIFLPSAGLISLLTAFTLVFILRRNFTVVGERRSFRYLCRWL